MVPLLSRVYSICPRTSHWASEQWYSWERRSEDRADGLIETLWSTSCVLALWDLLGMLSLLLPRSSQLVGGRLRNERRLMVQVGRCSCTGGCLACPQFPVGNSFCARWRFYPPASPLTHPEEMSFDSSLYRSLWFDFLHFSSFQPWDWVLGLFYEEIKALHIK